MDGKAVGRRIKEAREKRHLTQEELAARIDISPTHVSVIERGTKIPRLDTFVAIANALSRGTLCCWTWWTTRQRARPPTCPPPWKAYPGKRSGGS